MAICWNRWEEPTSGESLVMLQHPGGYGDGATVVMPGGSSTHAIHTLATARLRLGRELIVDGPAAIHFLFNGDNAGPHSVAQVDARYTKLRSQYPNAVVTGSTWDGFLSAIEDDGSTRSLPVVKKEEGDTWICECARFIMALKWC